MEGGKPVAYLQVQPKDSKFRTAMNEIHEVIRGAFYRLEVQHPNRSAAKLPPTGLMHKLATDHSNKKRAIRTTKQ